MRTAILGAAFLVLGGVAVATGLLPPNAALALGARIWPVLLFVVAITVLTELAAEAGLFSVIAERLARWGLNRAWLLWLLVVLLATVSTIFFSLDTTAVLLTPVVIGVARSIGLPPMPFALTTVWLANTASLLLPVSNLTNLLAADQIPDDAPARFASLMAAPAIAAVVVPVLVLFVIYRRQLLARYATAPTTQPTDRVLLIASAIVLVLVLPALVSGAPVWIPAVAGAIILSVMFAVRKRSALKFSLLPWQLVLFASGLFLLVSTASAIGLATLLGTVAGTGEGFLALLRLSGAGVVASNLVNNLPAYLALEATAGSPIRLAALLIGVNAGPLITPWASLATLLWRDRLVGLGVTVSWTRYVGLGFIVVPLTVVASVGVLELFG